MFEDSTFESMGRIHTRSRGWMVATLLFNGSILLCLILIPLIYPEALPHQRFAYLMTTPPPPPPTPPPAEDHPAQVFHGAPQMPDGVLTAPILIPRTPFIPNAPEQATGETLIGLGESSGSPNGPGGIFQTHRPAVIHTETRGPVRVPSTIVAGLLVHKVTPTYPPIAVEARQEGTVILQATISKSGTIENLRVVSGPPMLQQAALDAVQRWAYRPYLLNGEPVEVETTVNVVFTMSR